jgi:hypothetical protein
MIYAITYLREEVVKDGCAKPRVTPVVNIKDVNIINKNRNVKNVAVAVYVNTTYEDRNVKNVAVVVYVNIIEKDQNAGSVVAAVYVNTIG